MVIFIVTGILSYAIQCVLVALAAKTLLGNRGWSSSRILGAFFGVFALLDLYWLPAVSALEGTVTIGNGAIAGLLGLSGPAPLDMVLALSWIDPLIWLAQAGFAWWIISRVSERVA